MWKTFLLSLLLGVGLVSGCRCNEPGGPDKPGSDGGTGPAGDGGTDAGVTLRTLALEPAGATLTVQGSTPASQQYTVTGTFSDGHTEDLTSQATFSVDHPTLGGFAGATFTTGTSEGGSTQVHARVGTTHGSTGLTVKLQQRLPDSAAPTGTTPVPSEPESRFSGAVDAARKPTLLYPNDGVVVPPNLGQLEVHFRPGPSTNTLFELAFTNAVTDVRVYLRCYLPAGFTLPAGESAGCIYTPSAQVWSFVAESNRGGQPVQLTLRATDDSGSGTVGVSEPLSLLFSRADLKGALYYWTTSGGTGIMRYDFAAPQGQGATAVLKKDDISTGVNCVGCHALSRNGKKLVAEVNGQNDGRLALVDLSTFDPSTTGQVPLAQNGAKLSIFESWRPDGKQFVGVYGDSGATRYNLLLFNGDTAALEWEIAGTGTSTQPANHPDWSADGKTIAYTQVGIKGTLQKMSKGAIRMVREDSNGAWGAPVTVVPAEGGKNRFYPAIAPDSSFLVYNESICPSGEQHRDCNADTDPSAKLWAALLRENATPVRLARADAPGVMDNGQTDLTNSYPKWSPFVTREGELGSQRMWVTFSSSRMYGLRQPPSGGNENPRGTLLWMAAVDPTKVSAGEDPSSPAFALPFQDLATSNHIAQWAEYFVSDGCSTVGEGCGAGGATCCNGLQCVEPIGDPPVPCDVAGACTCKPIPQCALVEEACSSAAPCCDGLRCLDSTTGQDCAGGTCSCKPPCSGLGQACGANQPCCSGLSCADSVCQSIIN